MPCGDQACPRGVPAAVVDPLTPGVIIEVTPAGVELGVELGSSQDGTVGGCPDRVPDAVGVVSARMGIGTVSEPW